MVKNFILVCIIICLSQICVYSFNGTLYANQNDFAIIIDYDNTAIYELATRKEISFSKHAVACIILNSKDNSIYYFENKQNSQSYIRYNITSVQNNNSTMKVFASDILFFFDFENNCLITLKKGSETLTLHNNIIVKSHFE